MPVTREIILHATIKVQGKHVKIIQLGNGCRMYEDVETKGDTFKSETGMNPMDNFIDWYCIKNYGINLN